MLSFFRGGGGVELDEIVSLWLLGRANDSCVPGAKSSHTQSAPAPAAVPATPAGRAN